MVERVQTTDDATRQVDAVLLGEGIAEAGDKVVVISGTPPGVPGSTNDLRVHVVGEVADLQPVWESGEHAD